MVLLKRTSYLTVCGSGISCRQGYGTRNAVREVISHV